MRFDPPADVEGQQAVATAEAEGQPVRWKSTRRKDENFVNGRLVIHVELVELSDAVNRHEKKPGGERQKHCEGVNDGPTAGEEHDDNGDEDNDILVGVHSKRPIVRDVAFGIVDVVGVAQTIEGNEVHEYSMQTTTAEPKEEFFPIEEQAVLAIQVKLGKFHNVLRV
jgi:hypothetical protein